jgi:hypothetical protein
MKNADKFMSCMVCAPGFRLFFCFWALALLATRSGSLGGFSWGGVLVDNPSPGGPTTLNNVTIQNNGQVGLVCSGTITSSTSVLSTGNVNGSTKATDQISTSCGITAYTPASTMCGAQSAPQ